MKNTILFDLDGTLTDPKEGITKCVQYALEYFGISVSDRDDLLCFIGPPLIDSFQDFYGFSLKDAEVAVDKYRERYKDIGIFENGIYDGITDMLAACRKAGKKICLATSKPEVFARRILEKYGMAGYFDEVVGSTLDGSINAKCDVIKEAFRRMNIRNDEELSHVVMVGDRKHDIIGAKQCNIQSVGVRFGYAEEGELEEAGADYIVGTVEELKEKLLSI